MDLLKRACFVIVGVALAHGMMPTRACSEDSFSIPEEFPAPDPILQKQIQQWVAEMVRVASSKTDVDLGDFANATMFMNQRIDDHRKNGKADVLLQQLVYYQANLLEKANQIDTFMASSIIRILLMDECPERRYGLRRFSTHELLDALGPYLKVKDKDVTLEIYKTISYRLDGSLGELQEFLKKKQKSPPAALVAFYYELAPGRMLQILLGVYDAANDRRDTNGELYGKIVLLGENAIAGNLLKQQFAVLKPDEVEPDAARHLKQLAGHEAWWVRLYAAEIMRQQAEFREPESVQRLKDDQNLLVKRAMGFARRVGEN